jgi:hypothetical protein
MVIESLRWQTVPFLRLHLNLSLIEILQWVKDFSAAAIADCIYSYGSVLISVLLALTLIFS